MENSVHADRANRRSHFLSQVTSTPPTGTSTIKDFQQVIERVVVEKKLSFFDAVLWYCETTGMEVETAGSLIKSSAKMKARIQQDAEDLHFLPKSSKLPI